MTKVRRKRCKECNELFTPTYSTTQMVCSPKCAYAYSKKKDQQTKEKNKDILLQLEKEKKDRKKLTTLLKSVKNTCHEYIRLRDKGKPCISCGTQWHQEFQAGHFYKAETFSTIKFNELNIHGQCVQCNIRKDGNNSEYTVRLPDRIGFKDFEHLNYLASIDKKTNFKWERENLIEIRKYYRGKIKT